MAFSCDLTRDVPRHRLGGEISRGREGERDCGESWGWRLGWRRGWAGCAHRGLGVFVVPAMSHAGICDDHEAGSVTRLQHRFRVYTPERLSHVP